MVKKNIRIYATPQTLWAQVETEGQVCGASPGMNQGEGTGTTGNHEGNSDFNPTIEDPENWDE